MNLRLHFGMPMFEESYCRKETQNHAVESVRVFVDEAMVVMDPFFFLEKIVSRVNENDEEEGRDSRDGDGRFSNDTLTTKQIEEGQECLLDSHYKDAMYLLKMFQMETMPIWMLMLIKKNLDACNEHVQNDSSVIMNVNSHKDHLRVSGNKHNLPFDT
ncbi:hypothetical protein Sjap_012816 [Stephania japonica]|uniref:Uncharacterized protein n=1 Tax=Stephania japonica TaxID=461633 RepID=A0AAP0IWT6_9MAGN